MPSSVNLSDLGRRVRSIRLARKLTLEEVVSRADFTVSWLSKLENGQLSPSLEGLVKLAGVLECGVDSLVEGLSTPPRYVAVRNGEGRVEPNGNGRGRGVAIEHRADQWRDRSMHPAILHVSGNGTKASPESFPGERFLFVLEGELRLEYGDDLLLLGEGDSVYLHGAIPHLMMPATRGATAKVISVLHDHDQPAARKPASRATPRRARRSPVESSRAPAG